MDYNGKTYDDLKSISENLAQSLTEFTDEQIDEGIAYYEQYGDTVIVGLMKQWKEIKTDVGDFVKLGELSVDKSGKTLTTSQFMDFTGRDLTLTCVYNYLDIGFKVIPYLEQKAKAKNAPIPEPAPVQAAPVPMATQEPASEPQQDDAELVAVIAAAIAAFEGTAAADGFVVRSIKRRK